MNQHYHKAKISANLAIFCVLTLRFMLLRSDQVIDSRKARSPETGGRTRPSFARFARVHTLVRDIEVDRRFVRRSFRVSEMVPVRFIVLRVLVLRTLWTGSPCEGTSSLVAFGFEGENYPPTDSCEVKALLSYQNHLTEVGRHGVCPPHP